MSLRTSFDETINNFSAMWQENTSTIFIIITTFGVRAVCLHVFWNSLIVPVYHIAGLSTWHAIAWILMWRIFVGEESSRYDTEHGCAVGGATRAIGYSIALVAIYWSTLS